MTCSQLWGLVFCCFVIAFVKNLRIWFRDIVHYIQQLEQRNGSTPSNGKFPIRTLAAFEREIARVGVTINENSVVFQSSIVAEAKTKRNGIREVDKVRCYIESQISPQTSIKCGATL